MTTPSYENSARNLWYPGHMLKAEISMKESLALVDLVVILLDARAPLSTRNPRLERRLITRPHAIIANKADLANATQSRKWEEWFTQHDEAVDFLDASKLRHPETLVNHWRDFVLAERKKRGATRPLLRPVRVMIVGIPNIGKSTLVNRLKLKNVAKVANHPGVTRSNQWVNLAGGQVELLDTPGVLWPQLRDKEHELLLTALGNIPDDSTDPVLTAGFLIQRLQQLPIRNPLQKLDLPEISDNPQEVLEAFANRRNMLMPGGRPNVNKAAQTILKAFRAGQLGYFTLETPPAEDVMEPEDNDPENAETRI